jgi:hypothetical protein
MAVVITEMFAIGLVIVGSCCCCGFSALAFCIVALLMPKPIPGASSAEVCRVLIDWYRSSSNTEHRAIFFVGGRSTRLEHVSLYEKHRKLRLRPSMLYLVFGSDWLVVPV